MMVIRVKRNADQNRIIASNYLCWTLSTFNLILILFIILSQGERGLVGVHREKEICVDYIFGDVHVFLKAKEVARLSN